MGISKEPVRLRKRKTRTGLTSLYLDIYINGARSYEYLRMYLVPERNRSDKEKNRETLLMAESIRAKRLVEVRNGQYGFSSVRGAGVDFLSYFRRQGEKRKGWAWHNCIKALESYMRKDITLAEVTPAFCDGFVDYLGRFRKKNGQPLSVNSAQLYARVLKTCLNEARKERLISENPMYGIKLRSEETERAYLTLDELRAMASADCAPALKRAYLFSCLTGLRKSDIQKLTWGEVHEEGGMFRLVFRQKKTGGQEYMDISRQAVRYMGERGRAEDKVFPDFHYNKTTTPKLNEWAKKAGVSKRLTFHSARHTFAVMMLDLGADIYTVSKLLGHRELQTTQIYAKILDKNKRKAVDLIPDISGL